MFLDSMSSKFMNSLRTYMKIHAPSLVQSFGVGVGGGDGGGGRGGGGGGGLLEVVGDGNLQDFSLC